jgi:hypothetical protein
MARKVRHFFLTAISFLLLSMPVMGWDDVGHKITGYIAWQQLSPEVRGRVIKLLRSAPEDSHLSAFFMQYGPKGLDEKHLEYFLLVPTWADIVRDSAFPVRNKKYHRSNWHYSDTFWRQTGGRVEFITDPKPDGQGVVKLYDFDKTMRDTAASDADRAVAIAWFLHVAGDLHQPLHTSGRHTDREPNGDQGGNRFLLTPEGTRRDQQVNLHWFWDSIVGRNVPMTPGECETDYIERIASSIMKRYPLEERRAKLILGKFDEWQKETFAYAPTDVFRDDLKRGEMPNERYLRNAFSVSESRLAMAGYRMGATLEQIFGNDHR